MAADQNLSELLTEYKNLAESDQENQNFIGSIINNAENAAIIFGALSHFEVTKLTVGSPVTAQLRTDRSLTAC